MNWSLPRIDVQSFEHPQDIHRISWNDVGDGYFATIGTHLLAGREFTPQDRDRSICIINQSAARLVFSSSQPLNDSLKADMKDSSQDIKPFNTTCRVVGIAEDARYSSLRDPAPPTVYFPASVSTVGSTPNCRPMAPSAGRY